MSAPAFRGRAAPLGRGVTARAERAGHPEEARRERQAMATKPSPPNAGITGRNVRLWLRAGKRFGQSKDRGGHSRHAAHCDLARVANIKNSNEATFARNSGTFETENAVTRARKIPDAMPRRFGIPVPYGRLRAVYLLRFVVAPCALACAPELERPTVAAGSGVLVCRLLDSCQFA
jgi:hypothetical protein